jgi:hypothetical protein
MTKTSMNEYRYTPGWTGIVSVQFLHGFLILIRKHAHHSFLALQSLFNRTTLYLSGTELEILLKFKDYICIGYKESMYSESDPAC